MRKPSFNETRRRILQYIHDFVEERGYAPTVRDILRGCGISSTAVVQHHLNILEREGCIDRDPKVFRSIQLPGRGNSVRVPLLGTIAAGEPITVPTAEVWRAEATETIQLTDDITDGKQVYALRVKGLSMIDALIDDGDIVLMQPANTADNGDMVAVWLKERQEVTLKKIYREPGKIRLQPANSQMTPIYVDPNEIDVQGKVVGVIRKM
ncbi:MAG: repressor LexA [Chloroflexi bacterium]|nr:repressor LexA [Chloroflexota bacterium]